MKGLIHEFSKLNPQIQAIIGLLRFIGVFPFRRFVLFAQIEHWSRKEEIKIFKKDELSGKE